ncbi:hypothetical protein, partial [Psychrilyobacter sp.]|uniref:hypothetical protein n=1 Tax=Psychrilyobacter sp. TaxID=2586924 RepID=UPI003C777E6A
MKRIKYIVLFELLFIGLLNLMFGFEKTNPIYDVIFILFNTLLYLFYSYKRSKNKVVLFLLFIGLVFRLLIMYYDINYSLGGTTEPLDFYLGAENFYLNNVPSFRGSNFSGTTLYMGILLKFIGNSRLLLAYVGVISFMMSVNLMIDLMLKYIQNKKKIYLILAWVIISPITLMNTSFTVKEPHIILLVTLSFSYFIKWFNKNSLKNLIMALLVSTLSMIFHSGMFTLVLGYLIIYFIWDYRKKVFKISLKSFLKTMMSLSIFILPVVYFFKNSLFLKFKNIKSITDISKLSSISGKVDGASYNIPGGDTFLEMILYSPIRVIYFTFSPVPWLWRGLVDIIAFFICTFPYILIIIYDFKIMKNRKRIKNKNIIILLHILLISAFIVFA